MKNSVEIHEKFERYREKVKMKAYEEFKRHPRSSVDGNEVLRFYGTVMTCSKRSLQVTEFCKDPFCRVCRIIQSNFNIRNLNRTEIRLSTSSEEVCDSMVSLTKMKKNKTERAVIVCRIIAGRVASLVDSEHEDYDSFIRAGTQPKSENLIVRNHSAVLPCFVIVFN